jgi:ABC-type polysaccharide/polyol phosphate export permease
MPASSEAVDAGRYRRQRMSEAGELRWTDNVPSSRWYRVLALNEWWGHRELAFFLAVRDIKLRYRQTVFGVIWVVLRPLLAAGAFTVVFGHFADLPSDGAPYGAFVLAGMAVWTFVSEGVESAAESLVEHRSLVDKVWFPRALAPLAAVMAATIDLAVMVVLVLVVALITVGELPLQIVSLPLWLAAALLVAVGAGLGLAALNVLYRDVRYALGFGLQLWFFASPVVFPSSLLTGTAAIALALNPMTGILDCVRWAVLDTPAPPVRDLLSLGSAIVLLGAGLMYFGRVERQMADRI